MVDVSRLQESVVQGPPDNSALVVRVSQQVVQGPPTNGRAFVGTLAQYRLEGPSTRTVRVSTLAQYRLEGPVDTDAQGFPAALDLINPGAETGDMTGWTMIAGSNGDVRSSGQDGVNSHSGSYYFAGSASSATSQWGQAVNIPSSMLPVVDANGAKITGQVFVQGYGGDGDNGTFVMECFSGVDGTGAVLATEQEGPLDPTEWYPSTLTMPIPAGTRSIRLSVINERQSGTQLSIYYDDFSLYIERGEGGGGTGRRRQPIIIF